MYSSTAWPNILTCRSDDGSGPCLDFEKCEVCKKSLVFIPFLIPHFNADHKLSLRKNFKLKHTNALSEKCGLGAA
jgi:hypothetical protein